MIFYSCKDTDAQDEPVKIKDTSGNLNISILLDLSDRISPKKYPNPTMEYYLRDVGYINSISEAFNAHIRGKKIKQIDDNIQLFFDPAPLKPEINAISKDLKIRLDKENVSNGRIAELERKYKEEPKKLYQLAIADDHYIGSDTWKFFKTKVNDHCIEENHRNILIILTDGYIYYENSLMQEGNETSYLTPALIRKNGLTTSDWSTKLNNGKFGFIKANDDLSHLEILVLGINPDKKNPYEEDVIKAYWTNWFETMKVKRYEIRSGELPSDADKIIKDFILNKKP
ncbi:hypothetical protein [Flavobacterium noncentrifugens]|nr:hypothetical protein [Flavobacterium noncentrifugens]